MEARDDANATPIAPPPAPTAAAARPTQNKANGTKTARHWRVLRNALVSRTRDETSDSTASSLSTEFFPQFASELVAAPRIKQAAATNFEWRSFAVTNGIVCKRVLVHEKQKRQKVSLAELFSHQLNNGVDNTGNIRTWPSEQILLSYILKQKICWNLAAHKGAPISCCELGSGMAGLASLGLVAHDADSIQKILVTDGNPQCVENLKICIQQNILQGLIRKPKPTIEADLLRWDRTTQFTPALRHQYDLIFASDCLFFEDFHEDLAHMIHELLRPQTGVCYLLQPRRNGSMERFCSIASSPQFNLQIRTVQNYDPEIVRKHETFAADHQAEYVPDVHLPVLLEVRHPSS